MKFVKIITSLILTVLILAASLGVSAATATDSPEISYESYTYWQDYAGKEKYEVYCKPMYSPEFAIDAKYLGVAELEKVKDICADTKGNIYILDSGYGIIYVLDSKYNYKTKIEVVKRNEEEFYFDNASGLFVTDDGTILIANTDYQTVLATDINGNYKYELVLPESNIIPEDFTYNPIKVSVDSRGYTYILSQGSFYGALLYSPDNVFLGFFGANKVASSVGETIVSFVTELFMTNEKHAASDSKVPYQFVDLCIDNEDFVYTVTGMTDASSIEVQKDQVKRFSPGGATVLGDDGFNYADATVSKVLNVVKAQDLLGIAVDENNFVYVVDSTYGRVFVYDSENQMLCAFGGGIGRGNALGTFSLPSAIELNGEDVLVADSELNRITVFSITEYGALVKQASVKVNSGRYGDCKEDWLKVLSLDSNSQLAYRSLAKIYNAEEDYEKALEYAKIGYDKPTYSLAFKNTRRVFLAKYFSVIFICLILLVVGIFVLSYYLKRKNITLIKNPKTKTLLNSILHPFESFERVKYKNEGSVIGCFIIIILYYCTSVLKTTAGGFLFTDYDPSDFNSLLVLLQTFGVVFLWTGLNWAVCTLFGGIGKLKEIFVVISYSLQPLIISNVIFLVLSNAFVASEVGFLTVISLVATLYMLIMVAVGSMKIHDFSFGRFVATGILTLFGIAVVVFLIFIVLTLIQQFGGFLITILSEVFYS